MNPILFWGLAALAVVSALFVIVKRSPLAGALGLAVNMVALAGLFAMLSAAFLFIIQLLVYAGAVVVLIIFVIMLLHLATEQMQRQALERGKFLSAALVCLLGTAVVVRGVMSQSPPRPALLPAGFGNVEQFADALFTRYLLPFEIMGVILLIGVIGAVVIAKRGE